MTDEGIPQHISDTAIAYYIKQKRVVIAAVVGLILAGFGAGTVGHRFTTTEALIPPLRDRILLMEEVQREYAVRLNTLDRDLLLLKERQMEFEQVVDSLLRRTEQINLNVSDLRCIQRAEIRGLDPQAECLIIGR